MNSEIRERGSLREESCQKESSCEIHKRATWRNRNLTRERDISTSARAELARRKPASRKLARAGNPRCAKTRESVAGVREGSTKDVVDSCGMEAAPRRHNITILGWPPRARGGRRHGKEAGRVASPSRCNLAGVATGWGFQSRLARGNDVGTPGVCALRRRLCGFPFVFFFLNISLSLCLLRENSSFSLYHWVSDNCR